MEKFIIVKDAVCIYRQSEFFLMGAKYGKEKADIYGLYRKTFMSQIICNGEIKTYLKYTGRTFLL